MMMNNLYSIKKLDHQIDLSFCVPGSNFLGKRFRIIETIANIHILKLDGSP